MTIAILPGEFDVFASMKGFLEGILPNGTIVVKGLVNRVPEPVNSDFVVMTPIRRIRLETNLHDYSDALFTGTIGSNGSLTITFVAYGSVSVGSVIFGVGVIDGTMITKILQGSGGTGVYVVNSPQVVGGTLAAGTQKMTQPVDYTVQLDVHGPNSANNAHQISTMFRDEYGTTAFGGKVSDVQPLHADDPKQIPFINDQNQIETRWVVEAHLQANQAVVNIPQQFFDKIVVGLIEVDTHYPP